MIRRAALVLMLGPGMAMAEPAALELVAGKNALTLAAADVLSVSGESFGGQIDLTLTLTPQAGAALADFTQSRVGQVVSITFCGTELVRPLLVTAITGGRLALGGLSEAVAQALVAVVEGRADCGAGG